MWIFQKIMFTNLLFNHSVVGATRFILPRIKFEPEFYSGLFILNPFRIGGLYAPRRPGLSTHHSESFQEVREASNRLQILVFRSSCAASTQFLQLKQISQIKPINPFLRFDDFLKIYFLVGQSGGFDQIQSGRVGRHIYCQYTFGSIGCIQNPAGRIVQRYGK